MSAPFGRLRLRWFGIRALAMINRLLRSKPPSFAGRLGFAFVVARKGLAFAAAGAVIAPAVSSCSLPPSLDSQHPSKKALSMAEFAGKYKLVSSENFDEYMKAFGVNLVMRKMANAATPVQEIVVNGDEFYIKTSTTFKTTEIKFKLGVEFEEQTADGRVVKTTITREGNKLIQDQKGDKPSVLVREFDGDTMKMVLTVGDIICTRIYKKE